MEKFTLISYGAISKDFKGIAQLKKQMFKVKHGEIEQHRVDCYKITDTKIFETKFTDLGVEVPRYIEIFYPSEKYPSHIDGGGISYFCSIRKWQFLYRRNNLSNCTICTLCF